MLTEQDFSQMQAHILQVLPQLLRQNPEIATTIEGMLAHQFPRREEFIQLLNKMKWLGEDTKWRFERVDRGFDLLHEEVNLSFEEVNKDFELLYEASVGCISDSVMHQIEQKTVIHEESRVWCISTAYTPYELRFRIYRIPIKIKYLW